MAESGVGAAMQIDRRKGFKSFIAGAYLFLMTVGVLGAAFMIVPTLQARHGMNGEYFEALHLAATERDLMNQINQVRAEVSEVERRMQEMGAASAGAVYPPPLPDARGRGIGLASPAQASGGAEVGVQQKRGMSLGELAAERRRVLRELAALDERRNKQEAEVEALLKGKPELRRLLVKVSGMWPPYGSPYLDVPERMPSEMLVLLLAMLMGALGGLLSVARTFISAEPDPSASHYLMRPVFGTVVAFVIFLLFKAGQMTITAGQTEDQLNPALIGALGVVSGLMATEAIAKIESFGKKIFGDLPDRQGVGKGGHNT